ncbi:MAG TPA: hypothetical protein VNJ71_04785 [Gemmatimonadales bacterium]|jgi:hypothetical protein|nr:hypothetical protein [Gemmatimonadales bacterium]
MRCSAFLPFVLTALLPGLAAGQTGAGVLPPLSFLGFEAGAPVRDVASQVEALGGTLDCRRARKDPSVRECRATVPDPTTARPVAIWLAAIDTVAAVLTIAGEVNRDQLEGWRTELERQYGIVGARIQGTQLSLQWVRRGRMIRLTWRNDRGVKTASVSLVDGRVLDDWGKRRHSAPRTVPGAAPPE